MTRVSRLISVLLLLSVILRPVQAAAPQLPPAATPAPASSPVMFIENAGQFAEGARFQVRGGDGIIWLADDALWITLLEPPQDEATPERPGADRHPRWGALAAATSSPRGSVHLRLSFVGANPAPRLQPFDRLETRVSYFIGNDPQQWRPDVPVWGGVRYVDVYPGVDLEVTGKGGRVEQRLVVRDGGEAALARVRLRVEGAEELALESGRLRVRTAVGEYALTLLEVAGAVGPEPSIAGEEIATPFVAAARVSTAAAQADNSSDLLYATFLGGSEFDYGSGIALDGAGQAYVTGYYGSGDFPTTPGAYQAEDNGNGNVFVAKLNAARTGLAYATFFGGSSSDNAYAIAVDTAGQAYVTGHTWSQDFPTTPDAYDTTHNGGYDVFVAKLNAAGTTLVCATFLGGSSIDMGEAIAVDTAGQAYITGRTDSSDFPTTPRAYDTSHNGSTDAFVAKLNAAGTDLLYATFLGGSSMDYGHAIAVDTAGQAYVTGTTYYSSDFPTTPDAYDTSHNGHSDAFMAKLNAGGTALVYATFLGGSSGDIGRAIAVDGAGQAYVTGETESRDFPTTSGAYDTTYNRLWDAFVAKLNTAGTDLVYATFLGGGDTDHGRGIAVDGAGQAYVTGYTLSDSFPTTPGAYDTSHNGRSDAYVAKLNAAGADLLYATFLGGSEHDCGNAIAVQGTGHAYVTGETDSSDFPTTPGAYDTSHNGHRDAYVAKLAMEGELEPDSKDWLLMYYIAADNNLGDGAEWFVRYLRSMEGNPHANVAIMYDGPAKGDSRYYYIADNISYTSKGELNTGHPDTLVEFVGWARGMFPTTHSALVIYDHGSLAGVAWDDSSGDHLSMCDLKDAYQRMLAQRGKIDILFMNVCLGATMEAGFQARDVADFFVASQNRMWGPTTPTYLNSLATAPAPATLAREMAVSYAAEAWGYTKGSLPFTISAARLSRWPDLLQKTDALAALMKQKMPSLASLLKWQVLLQVQRFDTTGEDNIDLLDELVDVYHLAQLLAEHSDDAELRTAAQAVMNAIRDDPNPGNRYIMYNDRLSGRVPDKIDKLGGKTWSLDNSYGVAAFFPDRSRSFYTGECYDYAAGTSWPGSGGAARALESGIQWGPMLVEYVQQTNPDAPDDPTPPPLIEPAPMPLPVSQIYLPLVLR